MRIASPSDWLWRVPGLLIASLSLMSCGSPSNTAPAGGTVYFPNYQNGQPVYQQPTAAAPQAPVYAQLPYSPPQAPIAASAEPMFTASRAPAINAAAYILMDAKTGATIASHNADTRRAVASTQKILTALVVLDEGNLDKPVRVSSSDLSVEPTRLGIRAGEVYTRRKLLYAFLVKSANDVANVLARDNAGSISAFAAKMNAKARSLGATSSSFRNPHGLTVPGQYSTARDMARIGIAAYRNQIIRDAVRMRYYTFRYASGRSVTLENTNKLLGTMSECNGMKTGYTNASGRCLISTATTGGRAVILVQLGTKTTYIWNDGRTLMNWGLRYAR